MRWLSTTAHVKHLLALASDSSRHKKSSYLPVKQPVSLGRSDEAPTNFGPPGECRCQRHTRHAFPACRSVPAALSCPPAQIGILQLRLHRSLPQPLHLVAEESGALAILSRADEEPVHPRAAVLATQHLIARAGPLDVVKLVGDRLHVLEIALTCHLGVLGGVEVDANELGKFGDGPGQVCLSVRVVEEENVGVVPVRPPGLDVAEVQRLEGTTRQKVLEAGHRVGVRGREAAPARLELRAVGGEEGVERAHHVHAVARHGEVLHLLVLGHRRHGGSNVRLEDTKRKGRVVPIVLDV
mmetsp:Transcript_98457/g.263233  ORF Transcript_98457/g.263233 Transcript_98457/m.263233 type:complete len:297 (-) Transcript_98457:452-1342(-)